MMNRPVEALQQSFFRTKATDLASFMQVAQLKANSSNDTIFADDKGEIAYLHPQFVPRRDDRFDYTKPVDGSDPATDWGSLHRLSELPNAINPPNGWVQNTNTWPYRRPARTAPNPALLPEIYGHGGREFPWDPRAQLLTGSRGWTLEACRLRPSTASSPASPTRAALLRAYDALPAIGSARAPAWRADRRCCGPGTTAGARTRSPRRWRPLWGERARRGASSARGRRQQSSTWRGSRATRPPRRSCRRSTTRLAELTARLRPLAGAVGRDQPLPAHLAGDRPAVQRRWRRASRCRSRARKYGSLASFEMRVPEDDQAHRTAPTATASSRWSSSAKRVRAHAVTAGGESGHPASPHFNDEAQRYASGDLRDGLFLSRPAQGPHRAGIPPGRVSSDVPANLSRRADQRRRGRPAR